MSLCRSEFNKSVLHQLADEFEDILLQFGWVHFVFLHQGLAGLLQVFAFLEESPKSGADFSEGEILVGAGVKQNRVAFHEGESDVGRDAEVGVEG